MRSQVLLVTGPGGSGKSTLAQAVAEAMGWTYLSEDERWVANGWGSGLRSVEHERIVQDQVAGDLLAAVREGRGVALELILYKRPPNPLTAYLDVLADAGVAATVVVLAPPVDEILRRMEQRGRPSDLADLDRRRVDASWQLAILTPDHIEPTWIIDPTGRSVADLCQECVRRLAAG